MGRYAGEIQIRKNNGFFVNFFPTYELKNDVFVYLTAEDIKRLLPDSKYLNLNLFSSNGARVLEELFTDGEDVVLDFESEDLLPNMNGAGVRYQTAWKLDVSRDQGEGLAHMEELGYYCVVPRSALKEDWRQEPVVNLNDYEVIEGMDVMLYDLANPDVLVGPFKVMYSSEDDSLYVRVNSDSRKRIVNGFSYKNGIGKNLHVLEQFDYTRSYVRIEGDNIEPVSFDLITDKQLLENFRDFFIRRGYKPNRLDFTKIDDMLEWYNNSLLTGMSIPSEISSRRIQRLRSLFNAQIDYERSVQSVADLSVPLLSAFEEEQPFRHLIERLSSDDQLLERIGDFSAIRKKKDQKMQELDSVSREVEELQEQAETLRRMKPKETLASLQNEVENLEKAKVNAQKELEESLRKTHLASEITDLEARASWLEEDIESKKAQQQALAANMESLQEKLDDMLAQSAQKAMEVSFDNMIATRLQAQAAKLERAQMQQEYMSACRALKNLPHSYMNPETLVRHLLRLFGLYRPDFAHNDVINLFTCVSQGFLTIFTGAPGTGKSSICRILSGTLGMQKTGYLLEDQEVDVSRFVQVSVERGWSSRRDFIGYYNSLTRTFDKANKSVFDLLSELSEEARNPGCATNLPALILLDDANLSSMEYYWADFMALSEDGPVRGTINLGEDYTLDIPSSLRFAATINTDHTTEPLSSRLLDRAWVVALPEHRLSMARPLSFLDDSIQIITMDQIKDTFAWSGESLVFESQLEELFEKAMAAFRMASIHVSTRSEIAMRRYVLAAQRWMEDTEYTDAGTEALDYAISQRVLPQISQSGERFRRGLESLKQFLEENRLFRSSRIVGHILEAGNDNMQYYQYFS